ncbi:MAG: hypothetical protein ACRERU_06215, partial [Methylococcales bacterium]
VQFYCTEAMGGVCQPASCRKADQEQESDRADIERNNCRNRHWFKLFCRKSIVVSKSKEMVDLALAWRSSPDFVSTAPFTISSA